ncbi:MAG: hypothetical protein BV458_01165 [Thermoplasmata archaeon M9B2D]|nr:MAG: hypothetical protein BV458_01165 [Thermoplasmata archaeon M9B2D]
MKDTWMKKGLVVTVIILFIGVAVAPSINQSVVKASQEDDFVEVTTQACGIHGYTDTTVKLTREQCQNLEQYLVEFRARLNQTSTREEAVPIFKEAVVELDKYGLLPKGMGVEQAQKLVTGGYYNVRINKTIQRLCDTNDYLIKSNFLCLITGAGNSIHIRGILPTIMALFSIPKIGTFFGIMTFGGSGYNPANFIWENFPATGWVDTYGLVGVKKWDGAFSGGCGGKRLTLTYYEFIGARGFTGLGVTTTIDSLDFFIGSALWIRLYSE